MYIKENASANLYLLPYNLLFNSLSLNLDYYVITYFINLLSKKSDFYKIENLWVFSVGFTD